MRTKPWIALTGVLLTLALSAPAMATTGIEVDGKTYVVYGDQSTFKADGKTFTIGDDSVLIQEVGKPDRVLPLTSASDSAGTVSEVFAVAGTSTQAGGSANSSVVSEAATRVTMSEGASAVQGNTADSAATESALSSGTQDFSQYAKYGMSYDAIAGILYYQGNRVRSFEDSYQLDDNVCTVAAHFDPLGIVDVEAERYLSSDNRNADGSYDPSGHITGLRALSAEEFAKRDLSQWLSPGTETTYSSSGTPMTAEEAQTFYAPYEPFGLTCDGETGSLLYQGQVVRKFLDVRQSNGETLESGKFSGIITNAYNDIGTIDITTIRDYTKLNAAGDGSLIGMNAEAAE